jgi:hypothetical protein
MAGRLGTALLSFLGSTAATMRDEFPSSGVASDVLF